MKQIFASSLMRTATSKCKFKLFHDPELKWKEGLSTQI